MSKDNFPFETPIGQHGRHIAIKNLKNSWSKWGGIDPGLQKRTPEWVCQACGEVQPEVIDPFIFPLSNMEYLRICPDCQNKKVTFHIETFEIMIKVCRKKVPFEMG